MKLNLKQIKPLEWVIGASVAIVTYYLSSKLFYKNTSVPKIKKIADDDLKKWEGKKETDPSMSNTLIDYWKSIGLNYKPSQMQSSSFQSSNPWSAAYVSHLVKNAGYNFKGGASHSIYANQAKKDKNGNVKNRFWAFRKTDNKPVKVGDILIKNRDGGNFTFDTLTSGSKSHGDVIIEIKNIGDKKVAYYQGGNLSNSVKRGTIDLTSKGTIPQDSPYFMHLKYIK